jgi:hypothetical protein
MTRTVLTGAVVALLAALVAATGSVLGVTTLWPVLLAVAVGLAAGHVTLGRVVAYVLGAVVSWVAMAISAGALPQTGLSDAIVAVLGVVLVTIVAIVSGGRAPIWAGLAGFAAFAAYYEPIYAANPTLFLSESPVALVTVLLAGALGVAIATVAELLTAGTGTSSTVVTTDGSDDLVEGGVA